MTRKSLVNKGEPVTSVAGSSLHIQIPQGKYLKQVNTSPVWVDIEFGTPKKVALLFICLNEHYWPYIGQVIKGCKQHFLPEHKVDYFVWTDYSPDKKKKQLENLENLVKQYRDAPPERKYQALGPFFDLFTQIVRLYEQFYAPQLQAAMQELAMQGLLFKRDGSRYWFESPKPMIDEKDILMVYEVAKRIILLSHADLDETLSEATLIETDAVPWPSPTLMRYHLFLNQEEKLKEYDHLFYMDADMKVVGKVGDEILGDLTAAEHPMYSLKKEYIPPYEPNNKSTAYINRPGKVIDESGRPRFKPYYYAGGFQGGSSSKFIKAMKEMKKSIDKDFDNNYTAIWNDESHWNKYLSENEPDVILSPSYVYPDSLIKEYYEPLWGKNYEPKIITLTKPFTLSNQAGEELNKLIKR